jgi:hypothetical protein
MALIPPLPRTGIRSHKAPSDCLVRRAAVAEPGKLTKTLLGMSFLGQFRRAEMSHGVLVLKE